MFRQICQTGLLTAFLLFYAPLNSWAADSMEKIFISADHMYLNIKSGDSVYTGNVKISQGKLVLTGNKMTVEQSNNEIDRLTVTGKPARYNHVTEKGEIINAESEHMVYIASQNKLIMTVNAILKQPDNQVSSQKIIYDTQKEIIIAGEKSAAASDEAGADTRTGPKERQRVNITLTPKKQLQPQKKPQEESQPKK